MSVKIPLIACDKHIRILFIYDEELNTLLKSGEILQYDWKQMVLPQTDSCLWNNAK